MKKLIVLVVLATISSAQAATNTSKFDVRVPVKNWIKKMNDGFRVGIAQGSLTSNTRLRGGANSAQAGQETSENENTRTKIQLEAGYEKVKIKELGYSVFGIYQDIAMDDEDVRNMRLSANATYGVDPQVYLYGGLNWGKYFGSEQIETSMDSGIGMQAGAGFKIIKQAQIELEYLYLQNEGRRRDLNIDIETKGIMLKIKTPFTFDI